MLSHFGCREKLGQVFKYYISNPISYKQSRARQTRSVFIGEDISS